MDDDGLVGLVVAIGVIVMVGRLILKIYIFIAPYLVWILVILAAFFLLYLAVRTHKKDKRRKKAMEIIDPNVLHAEIFKDSRERGYIENFLEKHGLRMSNDVTEEELRKIKLEIEKWTVTKKSMMEIERESEILRILKVDGRLKDIELQRSQGDLEDEEAERGLTRRAIEDEIKIRDERDKVCKD